MIKFLYTRFQTVVAIILLPILMGKKADSKQHNYSNNVCKFNLHIFYRSQLDAFNLIGIPINDGENRACR